MEVFQKAETMLDRYDVYIALIEQGHSLTYAGRSEFALLSGFKKMLDNFLLDNVTPACTAWCQLYEDAEGNAFES